MPKDKINIVVSTGAGISKESGISTFRGEDGTWNGMDVEKVATFEGFMEDPERAYDFYENAFGKLIRGEIKPNKAHIALAELEKDPRFNVTIITQNIDDLHEQSGSKSIIHMHGDMKNSQCVASSKLYPIEKIREKCSCCKTPQVLRPNIVFFKEMPHKMDEIYDIVEEADIMLVIGTSGNIYPAAGLPGHLKTYKRNSEVIEFNIEKTGLFGVDKTIIGKASETVPSYVKDMLSKK